MVSEAHLEWLRQRGSRYIVGTPKNQLRSFEQRLLEGPWSTIREGLQVQLAPTPEGVETYILCRSEDRAAKEQAMRQRFAERIETGLSPTGRRLRQACPTTSARGTAIDSSVRADPPIIRSASFLMIMRS